MRILPICCKNTFLKKENNKFEKAKNNYVSFCGIQSKYSLINSGYEVAKINNNLLSSKTDRIIIDSPEKLVALSNSPTVWNKKIVLSNDVDLSKVKNFKPIGTKNSPFTGEFDGNDCVIKGLRINTDGNNSGLFGVCKNAKIRNVNIDDAKVSAKGQTGTLVGYANTCTIEKCRISNSEVSSLNKAGGLIGLSTYNFLYEVSVNAKVNSKNGSCGGLIGYDESSELLSCHSGSEVSSLEEVGGLIGYSNYSTVKNSYSTGKESGKGKVGGIIGWGDNSNVSKSYSKNSFNLIGYDNNSMVIDCIEDARDYRGKRYVFLDSCWDTGKSAKFSHLPKLKFVLKNERPEDVFLDDVRLSIEDKILDFKKSEYSSFEKPVHYDENDEYLNIANRSTDTERLQTLFGSLSLRIYDDIENKKYDEIFLALVKNPYFKPNEKYSTMDDDNYTCTPLFILTTLNRPYILKEALKRNDLGDIEKQNGWFLTGTKSIMERAIDHNLLDCVYVMLKAENQNFDIESHKRKSRYATKEMQNLFELYPNIPDYENYSEEKPQKTDITHLTEVLSSVEIPSDFEDIQGNSILNIAPMLEDEQMGLFLVTNAINRGLDINHKNNNGETPLKTALENNKFSIIYNLLKHDAPIKEKNSDGEDALFVFSKMENENMSNNLIDFCFNGGMSSNTQDNAGRAVLVNAIKSQKYQVLKNLLYLGANVNLPDYDGETPLHYACSCQDEKAMSLLLDNFANVFALNRIGKSPKEYLVDEKLLKIYENYEKLYSENNIPSENIPFSEKKEEMQKVSEKNKATKLFSEILLKNVDVEGNTFLHISSADKTYWGKEFIKMAIDSGTNINSKNYSGKTPLIMAIDAYNDCNNTVEKMNILGNIKYLLEQGADIEIVDDNGQSALHSACKTDNAIILNLLLKNDPKINVKDKNGNAPMNYIESENVRKAMNEYVQKITEEM